MSGDDTPRSLISRLFSGEKLNPSWKPEKGQSKCPGKKARVCPSGEDKKKEKDVTPPGGTDANREGPDNSCMPCEPPRGPPAHPHKSYPGREQCCYIKMQDPRAPCCREHKAILPPCPPKFQPDEPREPICECDRCKKRGGRCCKNGLQRTNVDPRRFQQC